MPELDRVMITAVTLFVVLSVGITMFSSFAATNPNGGVEPVSNDAVLLNGPGKYATVADTLGRDPTVRNSLGRAVVLSGDSDSFVRSTDDVDIASDETWTVSVWTAVNDTTTTTEMTAISADAEVVVTYDGDADIYSAWVYDVGSASSHVVNVSAPSPGTLTNVQVVSNGTHVAIYRNNTVGEVEAINDSDIEPTPTGTDTWNGRLDEFRSFDDALNSSQRQQLVDAPVGPLPHTNRTARIMFDRGAADTQPIYFSAVSLAQSNVGVGNGLPGEVLEGKTVINDITGTTDYVWVNEGPQIYVVEGGQLDGAPVAFADWARYPWGGTQLTWTQSLQDVFDLATLIPTVLILVVVISYLMLLRGGR